MVSITRYIWRELKRLQYKYDIIIRYDSQKNEYYVYSKSGKLEFTANGMQELIMLLHLYYD